MGAIPLPEQVKAAGYTSKGIISTGTGQADIWLATTPSGRQAAVKVFKAPVDYRSEREAMDALGRRGHAADCQSIPTVLERFDSCNTLVYEYIQGGSLKDILVSSSEELGLDPARTSNVIYKWALQLAEAVEASHAAGVAHCDLKADNVMMKELPSGRHRVVLIDFGLGHIAELKVKRFVAGLAASFSRGMSSFAATSTCEGAVGTVTHMAPESLLHMAKGTIQQRNNFKCDIYSLGCTLYEMATLGQAPIVDQIHEKYHRNTTRSLQDLYDFLSRGSRPELPRGGRHGVPDAVCDLIESCWASDKDARPTIEAVVAALRKICGVLPPRAKGAAHVASTPRSRAAAAAASSTHRAASPPRSAAWAAARDASRSMRAASPPHDLSHTTEPTPPVTSSHYVPSFIAEMGIRPRIGTSAPVRRTPLGLPVHEPRDDPPGTRTTHLPPGFTRTMAYADGVAIETFPGPFGIMFK